MIFRLFKVFIFLLSILCLAACGGTPANTEAQGQITQAPLANESTVIAQPTAEVQPTAGEDGGLPTNESGAELVARVNGQGITLEAFQRELRRNQLDAQAADQAALETTVLDSLIDQTLIDQAASAQQITVDPAELDAQFQAHVAQAGSDAFWQQWLVENQYTADEFRDMLRTNIITGRVIAQVTQDLTGNVPQAHARHILVQSEAEANDILARLQAGEDFATLAAAHSIDVTTREQGGDLGWFTAEELLEPNLAQVAFTIQPGEIAGPVPTRLGYHIIQTIERAERPIPPEKIAIVAQIRFENWLAAQAQNARIERFLS